MTSPLDKLDSLEQELSRLSTSEDKVTFVQDWFASFNNTPRVAFADARTATHDRTDRSDEAWSNFVGLMKAQGIWEVYQEAELRNIGTSLLDKVKPLPRLPCANVEPAKTRECGKEGKLACGACKLVSYCSKVSDIILIMIMIKHIYSIVPRRVKLSTGRRTKRVRCTYYNY